MPSTPTSSLLDPIEEFRNHLMPTIRLFDIARKIGVHRVLFPSSGGTVYGQRPRCPVTEDASLQPITPHSIVKVTLEDYLNFLRLQRTCPLDSIVYRIGNPYGPNQRGWIKKQGVISVFLRAAFLDEPVRLVGAGKTIRDYIFIDDAIDAILKSFNKPHQCHVYNIGSGEGISLRGIVQFVESVTGRELREMREDLRVGETTEIVLNIERIRREFKWQPKVSLLQGIRKTWEWIQTIADQELLQK